MGFFFFGHQYCAIEAGSNLNQAFEMGTAVDQKGSEIENRPAMQDAKPNADKRQCLSCSHWQARGGLLEARRYQCTAIEESGMGKVGLLMAVVAQDYAVKQMCPMHEALDDFDGAYRSVDLIDQC